MKKLIIALIIAIFLASSLYAVPSTGDLFFGPEAGAILSDGFDHSEPYRWTRDKAFALGLDAKFYLWRFSLDIPFGYSYYFNPAEGYYFATHMLYVMPSVNFDLVRIQFFSLSIGAGVDFSFTYRNHEWSIKNEPISWGSSRLFYRIGMTSDLTALLFDFSLSIPSTEPFSHFNAIPAIDASKVTVGLLFAL